MNGYDGKLYAFGKGQSATTVSASPAVVADGDSVLIQGTVMDMSPGAPEGTPCIADEYMTPWMEFVYEQQQCPANIDGVPVLLQYVSSSGAVTDITTVTSDPLGNFEYLWTPPTTDTYKVLATFLGSESYYLSYAQTALGVTAAPSTNGGGGTEAQPDNSMLLYGILIAVIIAIIIGLAALIAVFQKR